MNYIIAAAFVILCGQTVPEPMTLTDALTYVDTHPKERFLTEKEVVALNLTRKVWSVSSRCLTGGKCLVGSNKDGMEFREPGKGYWLITAKRNTSCSVSSTTIPEPYEGSQAVSDPVPIIKSTPTSIERLMDRPKPSGGSASEEE